MRKLVLLLAAAALAASPVVVTAKPKKTPEEIEKERIAQEHDNSYRAVRDSLPLFLPSWSLPVFFGTHMDEKVSGKRKSPDAETKKAKATAQ